MKLKPIFFLLFIFCFGTTVSAQKYLSTNNKEVSKVLGESNFTSKKTFYENLEEAPDFTILAKILRDDPLRKTLEKQEMVTIFAIADEAFTDLPEKTRDSILDNSRLVNAIVKYLAVPGRLDKNGLENAVKENGGQAYLTTVEGQRLGIKEEDGVLMLFDEDNNTATIIASDFYHKNGFFHIVNGLVFPPSGN
ncbi:fasciclin domain-containing protein [Aequorivita viscosa]|nr:fasciclin domain-containing protein [Aequorivita viscosa]